MERSLHGIKSSLRLPLKKKILSNYTRILERVIYDQVI